ncbi:MAG: hypothetical protein M3Z19_15420 [Chloroflexota bacterium]|nr:hypothetical protein [Chloroflexota bacterium]
MNNPMYAFGIFVPPCIVGALTLPAAVVVPTGAVVATGALVAAVAGATLGTATGAVVGAATGTFVGAGVSVAFVLPPHAASNAAPALIAAPARNRRRESKRVADDERETN